MNDRREDRTRVVAEQKDDDSIPEEIHQRAERILEALLRTPPIRNSELIKKNTSGKVKSPPMGKSKI